MIHIAASALTLAAEQFIEQVITQATKLSALQFHHLAPSECNQDLWLYAILTYLQNLPISERNSLKIDYPEHSHPVFNGNTLVEDISLSIA